MTMKRVAVGGRSTALYAGAAATAVGGALYLNARNPDHYAKNSHSRILLPRPFVEGMIGAIGEVAQISVLYPLETIKIKCQAECTSVAAVLRQMAATQRNNPLALLGALYSGYSSAALCSILVGAVHYLSFCGAKRLANKLGGGPAAAASTSSASSDVVASSSVATISASGDVSSALEAQQSSKPAGKGRKSGQQGGKEAGGRELHDVHGHGADVGFNGWSGMFAAFCGAAATAIVESPCELFRHQAQAGIISTNFLKEMTTAVRRGGPGALYWGFLPFCYESLPFDMTELSTFSYLNDAYAAAQRNPQLKPLADRVAPHVWDLAIGGAAGAAAVLVSMPFDCIKTHMQINPDALTGRSLLQQTAGFFGVGARMVAQRGPGALFVGTVPRLVQQVPSSTICWWCIETCRRALEPYTTKE